MMDVENSNLVTISNADHIKYVAFALRNLFESKRGTDFEFHFWGKSVKAHRLIVELFLTPESIGSDQIEASANAIKQDVPDEACGGGRSILDFVVEFLYTGEVTVPEQQLEELLGVAKELDFQMLVEAVQVCRPIDIIADVEPNVDIKGTPYCSETVNAVEEFVEPRIEVFDDKESLKLNEPSLSPSLANLRPRISPDQSTSADMIGSGHLLHDIKSQDYEISNFELLQLQPIPIKLEPEEVELANGGSDEEDDGGTSPDHPLPQRMMSDDEKAVGGSVFEPNLEFVEGESGSPKVWEKDSDSEAEGSFQSRKIATEAESGEESEQDIGSDHETADESSYCKDGTDITVKKTRCQTRNASRGTTTTKGRPIYKSRRAPKEHLERPFPCPHCTAAFTVNISLKRHMSSFHGLGDSNFGCPTCGKHCGTISLLKLHVRVHNKEKPFKCGMCDYAAKQRSSLNQHCDVVHAVGAGRHQCDTCGKRCGSGYSLTLHQRKHTQERPFLCAQCDLSFNGKSDLRKHQLVVHGVGYGGLTCETCGKVFPSASDMAKHVRIHTKEKPFKCPHCVIAYGQNGTLLAHLRTKHPEKKYAELGDEKKKKNKLVH